MEIITFKGTLKRGQNKMEKFEFHLDARLPIEYDHKFIESLCKHYYGKDVELVNFSFKVEAV